MLPGYTAMGSSESATTCCSLGDQCPPCGLATPTPMTSMPDLIVTSVQPHCVWDSCAPMLVDVCVQNIGPAAASAFVVSVNDSLDDTGSTRIDHLAAGSSSCSSFNYDRFLFTVANPSVRVDALGEVEESNEANNVLTFPPPSGT